MSNKRSTGYRKSIILSMLMWWGFCGREVVGEEIFGEQLAWNADSSRQTRHRRVSVIVSLRRNMNVCQKDCKNWWCFPVALQMVFPSFPPVILIAFSLAGLQLSVCFKIGPHCTRLLVSPSLLPFFLKTTHAVWVWETAQLKRGTLDTIKPKKKLSCYSFVCFSAPLLTTCLS